eukprot:3138275-Amphidinium_carterae.1
MAILEGTMRHLCQRSFAEVLRADPSLRRIPRGPRTLALALSQNVRFNQHPGSNPNCKSSGDNWNNQGHCAWDFVQS